MLVYSTQGRAVKRKQTHANARISFPFLPNQRMISDLLVRDSSISEGKALGMLCPDLINSIAVMKRRQTTTLDIQQE